MINKLRSVVAHRRPDLYAILDIGTVEAKALLVLVEGEQAAIVGAGRQAHQPGAIVNGSVADVQGAAKSCGYALAQAETQTEMVVGERLVAERVVVGISGPMLKGTCLSLTVRRPRPNDRLSDSELRAIVQRTERLVLQQAHNQLAEESLQADVELALVDADILHITVDGYPLTNAVAETGSQVDVRLSNVFAPVSYLATVSAIATASELKPVAILAGCCALARTPAIAARGDAIVIDSGGECTDIVLVRQGGIECVQTLPMGGVSLTRRISRVLGVPLAAAEEIKKNYAASRLDQERGTELRTALAGDVHTWVDGIQALLEDMAGHDDLPGQIFLAGGGAALPDLERAIRLHPWIHVLSFERPPQVTAVQPRLLSGLTDKTQQMSSQSFAIPVALAAWAVQSAQAKAASTPQRILQQVLHGMGLS